MSLEIDDHLAKVKTEKKRRERDNFLNTCVTALIGAGLGYWAWQTVAHAAFAFSLFFTISAVGNRVSFELFQIRAQQKAREIMDKGCSSSCRMDAHAHLKALTRMVLRLSASLGVSDFIW